jgi:hypothetical protein
MPTQWQMGADTAGFKNLQVSYLESRLFVTRVLSGVMCLTINCDMGHRARLHNDRICWSKADE